MRISHLALRATWSPRPATKLTIRHLRHDNYEQQPRKIPTKRIHDTVYMTFQATKGARPAMHFGHCGCGAGQKDAHCAHGRRRRREAIIILAQDEGVDMLYPYWSFQHSRFVLSSSTAGAPLRPLSSSAPYFASPAVSMLARAASLVASSTSLLTLALLPSSFPLAAPEHASSEGYKTSVLLATTSSPFLLHPHHPPSTISPLQHTTSKPSTTPTYTATNRTSSTPRAHPEVPTSATTEAFKVTEWPVSSGCGGDLPTAQLATTSTGIRTSITAPKSRAFTSSWRTIPESGHSATPTS